MRHLTTLAIALSMLTAATAVAASSVELENRNRDVVRRMVEAINARDLDALDEVVAPDVERHCAATPGVEVHSLDQFRAFLQQDLAAVPDSKQDIQELIAEGDMVAVRMLYSGTQSGPMGPFPPSGRKVEIPYIGFLRVEDGRIAEIWVEWDNMAALTQLGHLPPAGTAPGMWDENANKALARRWFDEVINGRDPDAVDDIYAEDYVYHGPGGLEIRDLEKVKAFAAAILEASPDRHAEVHDQVAQGDRVVTRFTSRGTRTGPWQGHPPTGEEWVTEGIVISRISNGRVAEDWEIIHNEGL